MDLLNLLVVLAACWSTGTVAWTLIAGRGKGFASALPSAGTAFLATGLLVAQGLLVEPHALGVLALSVLTLVAFVYSDGLPRWVRGQVTHALNAGALPQAARIATWAGRLGHPALRSESLRVSVLVALQEGHVEQALERQRALIEQLVGMSRLEAIVNLLVVLARRQDWAGLLAAYTEFGGPELLEEVPSLATPVLEAQGARGDLPGVIETLSALETLQTQNPFPEINELRALGLALLAEPQALTEFLEHAGTRSNQALALRQLAAVRAGLVPPPEARQALPAELLLQPAKSPEVAQASQALVERILAASQTPPPPPAFPTRKPRWGEVPLTSGLLAALAAVYVAVESSGSADTFTLVRFGACVKWTALSSEPWRLLTGTLLHAGLLHLAINGYALYVLGRMAEPVFGTQRLAGIYLLSALGGSLASVGWGLAWDYTGTWGMVSVGASGAIMGLLGALLAAVLLLRRRLPRGLRQRLLVGFTLPLALQVFMVIGIPNVDHAAHLGGFLAGALSAVALRPRALSPPKALDRLWPGVLVVAYGVAAILGSGFDAAAFYAHLPRREVTLGQVALEVPVSWRTPAELAEERGWGDLIDPLLELRIAVSRGDPRTPAPADLAAFLAAEVQGLSDVRRVTVVAEPREGESGWWLTELRVEALDAAQSAQLSYFVALHPSSQTLIGGIVPSRHRDVAGPLLADLRRALTPP
ncbi:MAG: rhomboid family intramembrane serine protease [Planctomycetota bacterium]